MMWPGAFVAKQSIQTCHNWGRDDLDSWLHQNLSAALAQAEPSQGVWLRILARVRGEEKSTDHEPRS